MTYTEEAALFACEGEALFGILAKPDTPKDIGVVVIVGGPQYRAGSHRQFVLLSRALAADGFSVLRFDYRGMGDSEGVQRDFESVSADVAAAIGELQARIPTVKQVALWGLCDGASAALLYCQETGDPRVTGLCLLNPWVRSEASLAKTQVKHYYTRRMMQREFWLKLLSGKVAVGALSGFLQRLRLSSSRAKEKAVASESFQRRMANGWYGFTGPILLILSGKDYVAREFLEYTNARAEWRGCLQRSRLLLFNLPDADHTLSDSASRGVGEQSTLTWLVREYGSKNPAPCKSGPFCL